MQSGQQGQPDSAQGELASVRPNGGVPGGAPSDATAGSAPPPPPRAHPQPQGPPARPARIRRVADLPRRSRGQAQPLQQQQAQAQQGSPAVQSGRRPAAERPGGQQETAASHRAAPAAPDADAPAPAAAALSAGLPAAAAADAAATSAAASAAPVAAPVAVACRRADPPFVNATPLSAAVAPVLAIAHPVPAAAPKAAEPPAAAAPTAAADEAQTSASRRAAGEAELAAVEKVGRLLCAPGGPAGWHLPLFLHASRHALKKKDATSIQQGRLRVGDDYSAAPEPLSDEPLNNLMLGGVARQHFSIVPLPAGIAPLPAGIAQPHHLSNAAWINTGFERSKRIPTVPDCRQHPFRIRCSFRKGRAR